MKPPYPTAMLAGAVAGLAALLASCADPYATGYRPGPPPPVYRPGYEVRTLPPGYTTVVVGGSRYYRYGDTYYRSRSGRYVVVEAPREHDHGYSRGRPPGPPARPSMERLPGNARVETHHGERYYRVGDAYYQKHGSRYVRVDRPR